jgi:hypothetical protein
MALLSLPVKRTSSSYNVVGRLGNKILPFSRHRENYGLLLLDFVNRFLIHISHCRIHRLCPFIHNPIVPGLTRLHLQTIAMRHCQEKVVHVPLLVVRFVILDTDDYFALVMFQMAWPTLQTIIMRHCQEKVVHMLLLVIWFVVLNVDDYFALMAFQMAWLILYIAWHAVLFVGDCDIHV